jgi:hypothetical protein
VSTEFIEFQDRSKLNETVVRLRDDEDVLSIDVIENGRTLRVVRASDADDAPADDAPADDAPADDAQEPSEGADDDSADPGTADEPSDSKEASDDAEDLLGEVDSAPADAKPEITPETDRNTLREIVEQHDLDVDIPTAGPLQPLRDRISAALAEKK